MELFVAFFFMLIYIAISAGVLFLIRRKTKRLLYTVIAVIILVLIPIWDAVLGAIVYIPSSLFIPKVAVYETAKTDGIYYEYKGPLDYVRELPVAKPLSERILLGAVPKEIFFSEGYTYFELRVTQEETGIQYLRPISPRIYRCTLLPKDPRRPASTRTSCVIVDQPMSPYMVKETDISIGTAGISIKKIYNRSTNKLMAEYRWVVMAYQFPFFAWLDLYNTHIGSVYRPTGEPRYTQFEYDVLKPNK